MAGIRQHILPKQLLKGFSTAGSGKEPIIWVYKKPDKVFEASISNVSVEKFFYGKDGELTADDNITSLEGSWGTLLNELRTNKSGTEVLEVFNDTLPVFVTHLSIRTKNLRDSFRSDVGFLLEKLAEILKDPQNIKLFIMNNPNLPSYIQTELDKIPIFSQLPNEEKDVLFREIENLMPSLLEANGEFLSRFFAELMEIIKTNLPQTIKEGHIKALSKDPLSTPRLENYKGFHWFVYKSAEPVILGDFGCLFETDGEKRYKSITFKDDKILNVILPISSDRVVVGSSLPKPQNLNFTNINFEIAKCCKDHYFCSISPPVMKEFLPYIDTNSDLISKEEIIAIVSDALKK